MRAAEAERDGAISAREAAISAPLRVGARAGDAPLSPSPFAGGVAYRARRTGAEAEGEVGGEAEGEAEVQLALPLALTLAPAPAPPQPQPQPQPQP